MLAVLLALFSTALGATGAVASEPEPKAGRSAVEEPIIMHAAGSFDVELEPQPLHHGDTDSLLGRMSIDKTFSGDLEATSKGEMLSARTPIPGSAGYVAIERVEGKLHGRAGSFVLQHTGTMNRGEPTARVSVVPDSGTGELAGIAGEMTIHVADGKHDYTFDYTLPSEP